MILAATPIQLPGSTYLTLLKLGVARFPIRDPGQENAHGKVNTREGARPLTKHPHGRSGSGSAVRPGHGRRRGGQARLGVPEPGRRERRVPSPRASSHPGRGRSRATAAGPSGLSASGSRVPGVGGARLPLRVPRTRVILSDRPSGEPARSSARGRGAQSAKAAGPRVRGPGRRQSGAGELGLYRPASRAAADPRGPGSSTIVSGRSAGGRSGEGCRAPAPPPPAGAIPRRLWGGWGTARLIANPRARSAAAGTAASLLHRRRGLNSNFLLIPPLLAGVSYRSVEGSSSHAPSSRQVDRGVRYHLPLQGSGNYCPRAGAAGAGAEK
uniref:Spidroin-2-like n=1 Tax=Tursiops truncatus TaxID=9739 RepID=A0A6J3R9J2_TURTR|nr:spidroin-2-like [Tursiops truncatus]